MNELKELNENQRTEQKTGSARIEKIEQLIYLNRTEKYI